MSELLHIANVPEMEEALASCTPHLPFDCHYCSSLLDAFQISNEFWFTIAECLSIKSQQMSSHPILPLFVHPKNYKKLGFPQEGDHSEKHAASILLTSMGSSTHHLTKVIYPGDTLFFLS
jgi:hypothetical protein